MSNILGRTWAEIQVLQGAEMHTTHKPGEHTASINGVDIVGTHKTETGLCMALEEMRVSPAMLAFVGQQGNDESLINRWGKK